MFSHAVLGALVSLFLVVFATVFFLLGQLMAKRKTKKWNGEFSVISNDGTRVSGKAGRDERLYLSTNGQITHLLLQSVPPGKLPVVEIVYGQILNFHLSRQGDLVALSLAKPIEPPMFPAELLLCFESEENKREIVSIEIRAL